jgi:ribonuclease VapC
MTLVVDASALVAIALTEPEGAAFETAIQEADEVWSASANIVEAGLVLVLREGRFSALQFAEWLEDQNIQETQVSSHAALAAYLTYGKGVHRAGLNMGDCFAYALAKSLEAPLLYKGDDFRLTDIRAAISPDELSG